MTSPQPDEPESFGYKCAWLAIRTTDMSSVARALGIKQTEPGTWSEGIRAAYEGKVFITPPLGPWVLAVSISLPDSGQPGAQDHASPLIERLGKSFPEVQYFGTHRVVEWHAWARVVNGSVVRKFAYVGDQGEVPWEFGSPTPEEAALGPAYSRQEVDAGSFPDETYVMALAARWSIDPSTLEEQNFGRGLGLIGVLPPLGVA